MNIYPEFISYGRQSIDEDDIQAVVETLRSPLLTQGPKVIEFEQAVADYVGAKYAVAFCNGTAALHGACYAAGIGQGDEVITTPLTFAASANCVRYVGGTVVFADIDERTYNIDPQEIRKSITSRTKAIIPVDFTGQPVDMDVIMDIAKEHNLIVIEDGAHSLGAEYKGKKVGSLADMTMFSFHPVKPVTTAEGGVIVTDSEEYYKRLLRFRSHGIEATDYATTQGSWYYEMTDLGYNYRMTDLQAALGLSQLKKLDCFLERRREIATIYTKELSKITGVRVPEQLEGTTSGWHLYMIQHERANRKQVFDAMRVANIGVHVHYIPVYWHPYYQQLGYRRGLCPVAEHWYEKAMTLPLHQALSTTQINYILDNLKNNI
ncbi:UDP-4-amino-4,6-dideoxy-N-acetyl-beta-L-altrosamine transaminase [Lysinibacillus fusiformis]|uniref:UDP-4-amino-4,6-dideoxy-N-acetyl-beta-L-altrosamine transaminase n=1 Tax=Lysinibacillus fusiformis TaxID=28031 RepID=A0A1H9M165_9BACI|nr:UDP-4-amino-4,6-dideoxy-N-acetyl-beta-L-altrosamine transaminase [Lysinibacillus fusiformis]SCY58443.1 UDP-4-amino-4,6-dideoxy-N-acetyl-beta-L-altrosamine transaminase [Lysinibacillus fusiformis]SEO15761.1 UDP-4-amino-4,6-dideoxy-N-acetyl-beta-L-altrosamine transaminase [Lysinibacillus fusiformis]SER17418.1 UDP-4-amino-4,6-dideoxy-N-acetyl-beta-L-altrosamine transaminase [Lysinibacillus fusiformis]